MIKLAEFASNLDADDFFNAEPIQIKEETQIDMMSTS